MTSRPPRRIGGYRIEGRVRCDGIEVYLAREEGPLGFGRDVTLRVARSREHASTPEEIELAHEAKIRERLDHPAIARVLELFVDSGRMVLALEGRESVTLEDVLERLDTAGEHLPDTAAALVVARVAEALAHAHARPTPLIHRAVSPATIAIAEDGEVRLSAFGMARVLDGTPDPVAALLADRLRVRAPEELSGAQATVRTDVFALGVLALQLFSRGDRKSVLDRAIALRPPRLASLRRDLPRELCAAVDAAVALDPGARTITCRDLARWLRRVVDLDAGRSELRRLVDVELEPPADELGQQRLSRALRRQAAARRRLRRSQATIELQEVEEVALEPEPPEHASVRALSIDVVAREPEPREAPQKVPPAVPRTHVARVSGRAWLFAAAACAIVVTAQGTRLGAIAPPPAEERGAAMASLPPPRVRTDPNAQCLPLHAPLPPPARRPPPDFGWVHVHAEGAQGQVFVAARPWGEPEQTILAPCGKYYVNVARTNSKGHWSGWQAIGQVVTIPCDGTIAEVSLARATVTSFTPVARPKAVVESCSWPMSKP